MSVRLEPILRALFFVAIAIALCAAGFSLAGYSTGEMAQSIVEGAVGSPDAIVNSLRWALPLLITSLGVIVSFRSGFFNVGAQGQFYMGAIGAAFVAEGLRGWPAAIVIPSTIAVGAVCGALWALWPGILRLRWKTDEVITTLMGNFIAGLALLEVTTGVLKDPAGTGQASASLPVAAAYRISDSSGVSPAILALATAAVVIIWLLLNRTPFGILAGLAGRNPTMMVWQGANEWRLGLAAFLISGGMAGLAGSIELLGPNGRIISGFLPTHGFTAVLIALVAGLSVTGSVVTALFFGGLASASLYLPVMADLPSAAIDVINGAIAIFITARIWPNHLLRRRLRPLKGQP